MKKDYSEYYPNKVSSENKFRMIYKNSETFLKETRESIEGRLLKSEYYLWKDWKENGKVIFDFDAELIEMLNKTDLTQENILDIKLPYSNFYIDLTSAEMYFNNDNNCLIEGVYISEIIEDQIEDEVSLIKFDFACSYGDYYLDYNNYLFEGVRGLHSYFLDRNNPNVVITIKDSLEDAKQVFYDICIVEGLEEIEKQNIFKIHSEFIEVTASLVINCLMYLSLPNSNQELGFANNVSQKIKTSYSEAPSEKEKERVLKKLEKSGQTVIRYIRLFNKGKEEITGTGTSKKKHWRRGHWRNQAVGIKLSERKLIWIMPTIINRVDDTTDTDNLIYKI